SVLVVRNGTLFRTSAVAEEQADILGPNAEPKAAAQPTIDFDAAGVAVTALTADVANRLGLPKEAKGVVVAGATRGGVADPPAVRQDAPHHLQFARPLELAFDARQPAAAELRPQLAIRDQPRELRGEVRHVAALRM